MIFGIADNFFILSLMSLIKKIQFQLKYLNTDNIKRILKHAT